MPVSGRVSVLPARRQVLGARVGGRKYQPVTGPLRPVLQAGAQVGHDVRGNGYRPDAAGALGRSGEQCWPSTLNYDAPHVQHRRAGRRQVQVAAAQGCQLPEAGGLGASKLSCSHEWLPLDRSGSNLAPENLRKIHAPLKNPG